ncbi:MAG: DinB family protein [Anaerolineaceae bacterium]|nr:DinB family protein [Anaerolineaceae bacterium]
MIILFDLDDTLLENSMETFLPAYLYKLGEHLSNYISPKLLPTAIFTGTEFMVNNNDPSKTLEECFDQYFYPHIGYSKDHLYNHLKDFYNNKFPALAPFTKIIPAAQIQINKMVDSHHKIVIATNPLFPKIAIEHRIEWANLGLPLSDFEYITNYEEMHFTKPKPEFIAEILGKLGWPDEFTLMVGNEWDMDIVPAELLGIPSFFIGRPPEEINIPIHPLSSSGKLDQVVDWIENINSKKLLVEINNSKTSFLAILRATAANIDSYQRLHFSNEVFTKRPKKDEWSLVEIFAHLADVDIEVNIPRLKLIEKETNPFIEAALTDQWAEERQYIRNNPIEVIQKFVENRIQLIEKLEYFGPDLWKKPINHAIFGPTSTIELIKFITQHDRIHISQIVKTINSIS